MTAAPPVPADLPATAATATAATAPAATATGATAPAASALPTQRPPVNAPALAAVLLGVVLVTLDISLTSTAVPAIARSLDVPAASAIWIINLYYLAVVAALLPLAALGEIHGHRRVFIAGLVVFAAGSLACALAGSLPALALGRALLGIGSAAVSATTPALIRTLYPPARLSRGLGLYAMVVGISFTVGPTVTSTVLVIGSWPWLYLPGVPLALLAILLAHRGLPPTEQNIRRFDGLSALLCATLFASLLFAIAALAQLGWQAAVPAAALFIVCTLLLGRREAGQAAPILAFDLFRSRLFSLSAVTAICAFTIQGLVFVVLPFLFQYRFGYSQVEAGYLLTPWPATLALMTLVAAPLTDRVTPGTLGGLGLVTIAIGLALLATLPPAAGVLAISWRLVICGIGFGLFQSPNMLALMNSAPRARSGSAGGILAASRLLGQATGAAVVAFCLARWPQQGMTTALWLGAAIALLGSLVSLLRRLPAIAANDRGR